MTGDTTDINLLTTLRVSRGCCWISRAEREHTGQQHANHYDTKADGTGTSPSA